MSHDVTSGIPAAWSAGNGPFFCIVDPSLNGFLGHHYEYDRSTALAAAAAGYRPVILSQLALDSQLAHDPFIRPTFRLDMWGSSQEFSDWSDDDIRFCNRMFSEDLESATKAIPLRRDTVIFGHMITGRQLPAWAWFAKKHLGRNGPKLVLLLRYDINLYQGELCRQAFRILERAARHGSLRLVSDSARLARQFETMTFLPVEDVAIPHTSALQADARESDAAAAARPLRIVSLGNARDEKGIFEVIEAIRTLRKSEAFGRHEFIIQCNDARPDVRQAIENVERLRLPNLRLIRYALDSEDYYRLLSSADIVLVPYWRSVYHARTSGVFVEAVSAGKVVICTENTWMSDELELTGTGLLCADRDVSDLTRKIRYAAANFASLSAQARAARAYYLARHNAERLVRQLTCGTSLAVDPRRRPRVALFYPWADIFERNAGASVRVNLLLDFLEDHGAEIRVLAAGGASGKRSPGVHVETYQFEHPAVGSFGWIDTVAKLLSRTTQGLYHTWFHLKARRDPTFQARVQQIIDWADVCLVEYTYWAKPVRTASRKRGIRQIVTDHDILSDQVKSWPFRLLTRGMEFRAMAGADAAVTVAPGDQARMAQAGIRTTLIPNPTSTAHAALAAQLDGLGILETLHGLPADAEVCLFVGSGYEANRVAVARIREIAATVAATTESPALFVTAGNCAEPERSGNFWALGRVDEFSLRALYARAKLVLIPLMAGTGLSVKSVEALALGKVIVGTSIALRGIDVESGRHCIIEDDLAAYPRLIPALLTDEERIAEMSRSARAFGQVYEYRNVYQRYLRLLDLAPLTAANATVKSRVGDMPRDVAHLALRRALETGKYELGLQIANTAQKQHPRDAEVALRTAQLIAASGGPLSAALDQLDLASSADEDSYKLSVARSRILKQYGHLTAAEREEFAAIDMVVRAAASDPQLVPIRDRAWELFFDGEHEAVLKLCEQGLFMLKPREHPDLHYLIGLLSHDTDRDFEKAERHYDRALALGFDEFWVRFHRARLFHELGRQRLAEVELTRALVLKPQDPDAIKLVCAFKDMAQ